jgi:hypothetical protein
MTQEEIDTLLEHREMLLAACKAALDGLYSYRNIDGNCSARSEKEQLIKAISRAEGKEAA